MTRLDASLGFLANRLAATLRDALEARLAGDGLTAPQWAVLMRLMEKEGWAQTELGESLGMDKATVGGIVQRLERKKLIRRRRGGLDARRRRVSLTDAGRRLAKATAHFGEAVNAKALVGFSDAEEAALKTFLNRAYRTLAT